jgi:hypothetical protein
MANINVYDLAKKGVNTTKAPVQLDDGELTKAQNAIPDRDGFDGILTNRPGLVKFDADVAAGSIHGFIGVPLGPGPGTTTDDETVYYLANEAGTWFKSTNSFNTSSAVSLFTAHKQFTLSAMLGGRLFYIATDETVHVFDGIKDSLFFDPHSTFPTLINLYGGNGFIYIVARDGSSNDYVLELDSDGRSRQLGAAIPSNYGVSNLRFHQNDLYAGCVKNAAEWKVFRIRPAVATTTTVWTTDFTSSSETDVTAVVLESFKGLLYSGPETATAAARVRQRSAAGSWSAVDSGSAADDITSLREFNGFLYAAWSPYSAGNAVIRRSSTGSSWATVKDFGAVEIDKLIVVGNKLWLINSGEVTAAYSTNGTTYTSVTTASAIQEALGFFSASGSGPAFGATKSFVLLQGASSLQLYNQSGTLLTLTLPTGVTLDTDRPPRFALYGKYVIAVNTPSRPITIDGTGKARVLTPLPPNRRIILDDDGGAGGLTGDYKVRQTFVIKDLDGNIITESDFSPVNETAFAASSNTLDAEELNISVDEITGSKIYRTTAGGSTYFPWIDVDGNVLTESVSDDTTDAALSLVAAPTLGSAPNLSLVASWRDRVWGVDRADVDELRFTGAGSMYAWPAANGILVGRRGSDLRGITALIPRRDALGIGRQNSVTQVTGTSSSDFRAVTLSENTGVESQETVKVHRDIAYWLGKDGVYKWSSQGIESISDNVSGWFTTDTYFNQGRFQFAFAEIDPIDHVYRLYLAAVGTSEENRWVEYDIDSGTWWGPHKTDAFTPKSAGFTTDSNGLHIALVSSTNGFLWKDQDTRTDDTATAIAFDVDSKEHDANSPNIDKAFLRARLLMEPQSSGRLTATPSVGELDAVAASQALQADMTIGSQELGRLGRGKVAKLNFQHSTAGQKVQLYGYELEFHELGRR